jgi:DNA-binding GntR family transcriptional regulator
MSRSDSKELPRKLAAIRPLSPPRSLATELVERLTADITSGKIAAGSRLPTEQEMIVATGVSRTVVREAVAALRAEGLVVTRQGIGTIVADGTDRPFRLNIDDERSLLEVLEVAELRTGVEIEAAGLAAERGSAEDLRKVTDAFAAIEIAIRRDEDAIEEDFAFRALPGFSRALHHSAADDPRRVGRGRESPRLSRSLAEGAPGDLRGYPRARGHEGARGDASSSSQQPQALSPAGGKARPHLKLLVNSFQTRV